MSEMHLQRNVDGKLEAVGSIHHEQLAEADAELAPHLEQPLPERIGSDEPITAQGVPPSTVHANQEPAADPATEGSVTTADLEESSATDEPVDGLSEHNTRAELDEAARKVGLDPDEYGNKRELLDAIEEQREGA